jgi:integrase/recombinase XerD
MANATIQQHLAALRMFYDLMVEDERCNRNPFRQSEGRSARSLVQREHKLPTIPTEEEWCRVLAEAAKEPIRNRLMLAMSYDAGLRREERCLLETADIDPSRRTIRVRAETTKNRRSRVLPYSVTSDELFDPTVSLRVVRRCVGAKRALPGRSAVHWSIAASAVS